MLRFVVCIPSLVIVLSLVVGAQGTVMTPEEHAKVMKSNAGAVGPMNKAIGSGAFADARTQVATLRQNFTALQGFWAGKKKDDAVGIIKDGLTRLDALDKILSAPAPGSDGRAGRRQGVRRQHVRRVPQVVSGRRRDGGLQIQGWRAVSPVESLEGGAETPQRVEQHALGLPL